MMLCVRKNDRNFWDILCCKIYFVVDVVILKFFVYYWPFSSAFIWWYAFKRNIEIMRTNSYKSAIQGSGNLHKCSIKNAGKFINCVYSIIYTFDVARRYNGCSVAPHYAITTIASCGAPLTHLHIIVVDLFIDYLFKYFWNDLTFW
jgi:hypothetical protein